MASSPTGPTNVGLDPKVGGLLCYAPCCIGLVFSVVVAVIEKQSRFLRFHAFQSLLFHGALIVLSVGLQIASFVLASISPMLGSLISLVLSLVLGVVGLGGTILLMVKAYNGEEFELPTLGQLAKGWA